MERQSSAEKPAYSSADGSRIWLPELVERFAIFIDGNETPCTLRLVNKATASQFRGRPKYTTVRLSQPVPHHAFVRRWGAPGATRLLNRSQRHRMVRLTAASGSIPNLEVAVAAVGGPLVARESGLLDAAARVGQLGVCSWILRHDLCEKQQHVREAAQEAARAGQQETVEFLLANGARWEWNLAHAAARGGHPALVDWLLLRRPQGPLGPGCSLRGLLVDEGLQLFIAFAASCSLAELQGVHQRVNTAEPPGRGWWYSFALHAAAGSPTADWQAKVEWLEATEPEAREEVQTICDAAAGCPDAVDRLRWLQQRGYSLTTHVAWEAAISGNAAALEYVLAEGVAGRRDFADTAAMKGRMDILEVLHSHLRLSTGNLGADRIGSQAAQSGHLPVLAWAAEELGLDLPSTPGLMTAAARSGSVELLAWLHERGCGWDGKTFAAAAGSGCEAALEWLAERGCPMGDDGAPYLAAGREPADPPILLCLRRLGCPWGPVGQVFVQCMRSLPSLRCLAEAGCPVDLERAVWVARGGDYPDAVVLWLEEQLRLPQHSER